MSRASYTRTSTFLTSDTILNSCQWNNIAYAAREASQLKLKWNSSMTNKEKILCACRILRVGHEMNRALTQLTRRPHSGCASMLPSSTSQGSVNRSRSLECLHDYARKSIRQEEIELKKHIQLSLPAEKRFNMSKCWPLKHQKLGVPRHMWRPRQDGSRRNLCAWDPQSSWPVRRWRPWRPQRFHDRFAGHGDTLARLTSHLLIIINWATMFDS